MTLIVNYFGAAGVGKSTTAANIFSRLKRLNYNVEYVQEFAKSLTWENNHTALSHQLYVTGTQSYMQNKLLGKVDAVITDSPILLGLMYYNEPNTKIYDAFYTLLMESFKVQNNINFFINRTKPYNPKGRNQTIEESLVIDDKILKLLAAEKIPYTMINGDDYGVDVSQKQILEKL